MSYQEKTTWVYAICTLLVSANYFMTIARRIDGVAVDEVAYVGALLGTIAISVIVQIVGAIVVALSAPSEAEKLDERDRTIDRRGEYVGAFVLVTVGVLPFGLTLARFDHFWIANAMFAAFVLAVLASSTVKLVAYRRGF